MAFQLYEFKNITQVSTALAQAVINSIQKELKQKDSINIAFSGGKSPLDFLKILSTFECEWQKCNISLVDERLVESHHPDSNAGVIKNYFLQNSAKVANFTPFFNSLSPIDVILKEANHTYKQPNLAILGMGNDGHTASLFPNALDFKESLTTEQNIVFIEPQNAPHKRLSMSLSALQKCDKLFLLIIGDEKKQIFNEAAKNININLPISYILHSKEVNCDVYFSK